MRAVRPPGEAGTSRPFQAFKGMKDFLKYLTGAMHRAYDSVVQRPMPWRMIDTLTSLEEAEEERARKAKGETSDVCDAADPDAPAPPPKDSRGHGVHGE